MKVSRRQHQDLLRELCETFAAFAVKGFKALNRKAREERRKGRQEKLFFRLSRHDWKLESLRTSHDCDGIPLANLGIA